MAASSRTRSPSLSGSITPAGRIFSGAAGRYSSCAPFASSSASPARLNLIGSSSGRFLDPISANRSPISAAPPRKTCMCSPTTHPGSFRCSLHKSFGSARGLSNHRSASSPSNRLNARRSAMTNSLVRIGTVEGELVKRALSALIRPSSHQQRRRAAFQRRPSRLSVMSKAVDV